MNIRKDSAIFRAEIAKIQGNLPRGYVMAIKAIRPDLKHHKNSYFYSVVRGVTVNWEILKELKKVVIKKEENEGAPNALTTV